MAKISRKRKHLVMLPVCALFFFIGVITVQAATYYVATTGNDSNPGTVSQPFRSIARGVSSLNAGDTLYIRSGTWTETLNVSSKTGTVGNYITLAAYPGETVTLTDPPVGTYEVGQAYFIFDGFVLDGISAGNDTYWSIGNGAHDIIVRNTEIKRWKGNGLLIGKSQNGSCSNITIQNNRIHDQVSVDISRWYGIYMASCDTVLLEGNDIYNNPGGGMHLYPGPTTNLTVRRNRIHDNNTMATAVVGGIILQGSPSTIISNTVIANNLVYNNGSAAGGSPGARGIQINQYTNGTKVWNNTLYGNKSVGIQVGPNAIEITNTVVQNNISYNNGVANYSDVGANTTVDHNLTINPNFANAAAFDFRLQTSSPAIDAGVTLSQVNMDINKAPRPQGTTHDIGAYEGGAGSDTAPPRAPVGLKIN